MATLKGKSSVQILTNRQRELLQFIDECVNQEHRVPSYREMAKAMKVSAVGTIQDHIKVLLDKGFIEKTSKGLKLAGARQGPVLSVPIIGEVAAGSLQDAYEVAMGAVPLSPDFLRGKASGSDFFALRVVGESMIEAGINPKDFVIVQKNARVKTGDIVVASHRGEATVKELRLPKKDSGLVELIPKNKTMKTIVIKADEEFKVLGKVVAVHRYL